MRVLVSPEGRKVPEAEVSLEEKPLLGELRVFATHLNSEPERDQRFGLEV